MSAAVTDADRSSPLVIVLFTVWFTPDLASLTGAGHPPMIGALPSKQVKLTVTGESHQLDRFLVAAEIVAVMTGAVGQFRVPARSTCPSFASSSAQKTGACPSCTRRAARWRNPRCSGSACRSASRRERSTELALYRSGGRADRQRGRTAPARVCRTTPTASGTRGRRWAPSPGQTAREGGHLDERPVGVERVGADLTRLLDTDEEEDRRRGWGTPMAGRSRSSPRPGSRPRSGSCPGPRRGPPGRCPFSPVRSMPRFHWVVALIEPNAPGGSEGSPAG